jgi:hypothetical protein
LTLSLSLSLSLGLSCTVRSGSTAFGHDDRWKLNQRRHNYPAYMVVDNELDQEQIGHQITPSVTPMPGALPASPPPTTNGAPRDDGVVISTPSIGKFDGKKRSKPRSSTIIYDSSSCVSRESGPMMVREVCTT